MTARKFILPAIAVLMLGAAPVYANDMWKSDTNKDGVISKDEYVAHAQEKFDMIDSNKDGSLSKEEGDAAKAAWKKHKPSDKTSANEQDLEPRATQPMDTKSVQERSQPVPN